MAFAAFLVSLAALAVAAAAVWYARRQAQHAAETTRLNTEPAFRVMPVSGYAVEDGAVVEFVLKCTRAPAELVTVDLELPTGAQPITAVGAEEPVTERSCRFPGMRTGDETPFYGVVNGAREPVTVRVRAGGVDGDQWEVAVEAELPPTPPQVFFAH